MHKNIERVEGFVTTDGNFHRDEAAAERAQAKLDIVSLMCAQGHRDMQPETAAEILIENAEAFSVMLSALKAA